MIPLTYVLPLRWEAPGQDAAEMTAYLRELVRHVPVIVVDGSPPDVFAEHSRLWSALAWHRADPRCPSAVLRHVPPDPALRCANGKVAGVITGVRLAATERVVVADDDVRYDAPALAAVHDLLAAADVVRPQNHFDPLPWHARWDTARSLLNRALGADYPGTLGVRRPLFMAMGGYDGDVLFENLELIRTIRAHGGRELRAPGLYVRRLPPDTSRFLSQRIRQAYDDLAQPARLAFFLAVLPAAVTALLRRRYAPLAASVALAVALAEIGRRRAGGRARFPFSASLLAPAWLAERAVCVWIALAVRLARGGIRYRGALVRTAAHSVGTLRRRASRRSGGTAGRSGQAAGRSGSPGARNPAAL